MLFKKDRTLFYIALLSACTNASANIENQLRSTLLKLEVHSAVERRCGSQWGAAPKVLKEGSKLFLSQLQVQKLQRSGKDFSPNAALVEDISKEMCITGDFIHIPTTSLLSQVPTEVEVVDTGGGGNFENIPVTQTSTESYSYDQPRQNTEFGIHVVTGTFCVGVVIGSLVTHYYLLLRSSPVPPKTVRRPEL